MSFRNLSRTFRNISVAALMAAAPLSALAYTLPEAKGPAIKTENLETLQRVSKGIAAIAKHANQSIVFVSVYKTVQGLPQGMVDPFEFFFGPGFRGPQDRGAPDRPQKREGGLGSGFFIDLDKGYILTNNHVVQGADEIQLKLANGESYEGKIVGRDQNTDVAVVQVSDSKFNRKGLTALAMSNSDQVEVGDFVVALGAPFGLEASLSFGVVSAIGRGTLDITKLGNFIQTDAAINPGNSGGPLLDMTGNVIGVNTAIYSRSGGYNGIGFAVPANLVRTVADQLINQGYIRRGYLGVYLQPVDEEMQEGLNLPAGIKQGALVARVAEGGPADKAGLEPGDVIVEVNGQQVKDSNEIVNTIGLMKPGTTIELQAYRDGKRRDVKVTIGQHPDDSDNGRESSVAGNDKEMPFGMSVANLTSGLRDKHNLQSKKGALILDVTPDGPADRAGLRPGDLILKIDGKQVDSLDRFKKLIDGKKRVLIWIERSGEFYFVTLRETK